MPSRVDYETIVSNVRTLEGQLVEDQPFSGNLKHDLILLRQVFEPADDISVVDVEEAQPAMTLVYHGGLVEVPKLPFLLGHLTDPQESPGINRAKTPAETLDAVLKGSVAVFREGENTVLVVPQPASLPIEQPTTERVVRGPHLALMPDMDQNLALIRTLVQRRDLRVEYHSLDPLSLSKVVVVYLGGAADPGVRDILVERLKKVRASSPVDVTLLKPALADDPWSPFVNVQLTERVDLAATKVLRGGYVVMTTGSSEALLLPTTFIEMMSSPEDSYLPRHMANFDRMIRYGAAFTALLMEALYIALVSVNQDLLPTPLAFAIARSRSGVPLPVVAEVILMALVIEVLKEAAIRLPKILSQTIAIVGALVIGQAVVTASLISAPVIVIVAFVALASFALPQYELAVAIRMLRFPAMIIAAILGLFGLSLYLLLVLAHLAGLRSFGTPYLGPLSPRREGPLPVLVRLPPRVKRAVT